MNPQERKQNAIEQMMIVLRERGWTNLVVALDGVSVDGIRPDNGKTGLGGYVVGNYNNTKFTYSLSRTAKDLWDNNI